ncbi:MAG: hypothetical protein WB586_21640 [Chthoniobacterales bacterium]
MKQPYRYMERVTGAWESLQRIVFEQAGLETVFVHVRNLVIPTLIIAAGAHAIDHGPSMRALAVFELDSNGYAVAFGQPITGYLKSCNTSAPLAR